MHNPKSTHGQGKLECWIELLTLAEAKASAMWLIKPAPPDPYELRLIIWKVQKVVQRDAPPEVIDLFVSAGVSIAGVKGQETDTHFRARSCTGSFNWRMKFPILLPPQVNGGWPRLRICVWDKELLAHNDSICETMLSLKGICKRAMRIKDRLKVVMKGEDKFVLKGLRHPNHPKATAEVEMSLEIMPLSVANQLPAGLGRGDPNTNPHLPEPEGRMRLVRASISGVTILLCVGLALNRVVSFLCVLFVVAVPSIRYVERSDRIECVSQDLLLLLSDDHNRTVSVTRTVLPNSPISKISVLNHAHPFRHHHTTHHTTTTSLALTITDPIHSSFGCLFCLVCLLVL